MHMLTCVIFCDAVLARPYIYKGKFVQHSFTLTPTDGTDCVGIAPGSDPTVHCTSNPGTAHVCIKCGGQITFAVVGSSTADVEANIDYAVFQPGQWGRVAGQNARKDVFDTLATMGACNIQCDHITGSGGEGVLTFFFPFLLRFLPFLPRNPHSPFLLFTAKGVKIIRLGGSFCSVTKDDGEYYQWQKWTGPVWERPSIGAHWDSYGGHAYNLIGGWGPFEMIDYAVALVRVLSLSPPLSPLPPLTHRGTRTRTHTHAHTHTLTFSVTHASTHPRIHAYTHTRAHTNTHMCTMLP